MGYYCMGVLVGVIGLAIADTDINTIIKFFIISAIYFGGAQITFYDSNK